MWVVDVIFLLKQLLSQSLSLDQALCLTYTSVMHRLGPQRVNRDIANGTTVLRVSAEVGSSIKKTKS